MRRVGAHARDRDEVLQLRALGVAELAARGRAAAAFAAFVPIAYLGISLTNGYTLAAGPAGM